MLPETLKLGPLALSFYGLAVAAGVLAGLAILALTAPRRGLTAAEARDFGFWMVLAGLVGSRAAYVAFHWPYFEGDWPGILAYWRGGLMFQGGLVGALLVAPFFLKNFNLPFLPTADALVPALALGQALGRLGCFAAGCCYGQALERDHFWAVTFPAGALAPPGVPLWPTQAAEAGLLAVLALGLTAAVRSDSAWWRRPGQVTALYLAGAGALRLTLEFFRGDFRGEPILFGLPPTTLAAALTLAFGLVFGLARRPRAAAA